MLTLDTNLTIARDYFTTLGDPALGRLVAALEEPYRDLALLVRDVGHLATDGWDALTPQQVRDLTLRVATALTNPFIETDSRVSGMLVVWLTQRVTALEEKRRENFLNTLAALDDLAKAQEQVDHLQERLDDIQDDAAKLGVSETDFAENGIWDIYRMAESIMEEVLEGEASDFMKPSSLARLRLIEKDATDRAARIENLEAEVTRLEGQIQDLESELAEAQRERD